ncbi:MAG: endopygalactorunase [Porphyromonadaceae bacterium]|nr:endopygalactorunase [Porphyromonadaceae bacterium]
MAENTDNTPFCSFLPEKYIYKETPDSLIFISGLTQVFTVDTPENEGLTSTTLSVEQLMKTIDKKTGVHYRVFNSSGLEKTEGSFESGDYIEKINTKTEKKQKRKIGLERAALKGTLLLNTPRMTASSENDIILSFYAGQRSPMAEVIITIPKGIRVTKENTFINVIGRGEVSLKELPKQSVGRTGTNYSYSQVGNVEIKKNGAHGQQLILSNLDFRPANGADLVIRIQNPGIHKTGQYLLASRYKTSAPESYTSPGGGIENATLTVVSEISDFVRTILRPKKYERPELTTASFSWTPAKDASGIKLLQSTDKGKTWQNTQVIIEPHNNGVTVENLTPNQLYAFRLEVIDGPNRGNSNIAWHYSGMLDVKTMGATGDGKADDTEKINEALAFMNKIGGGIVLFSEGQYNVRTVYLQSNVWLYVDQHAIIQAIEGSDEPETTWFSDRAYRSGLSPTDPKPYQDPENYLTKQDVGHTFFRNAMFFAERADNIKIIGNGYITGNGILATSDRVMNNVPGKRADKMFSLKLCTNIEIGGLDNGKDLWYDPEKDLPYYIGGNGQDDSNMLQIDRGGHFVLLATGTDHIYVHNTYFAKKNSGNARDIYDFMACNNVTVTNIYSKISSDDIVKLGSDCSLGFTRPVKNYMVRNIIGDTNCNLFQIGSETADDIQDVYVDNIYVLGANKAGFSISTNDGAHIKNIHLNSGRTGSIHSRSVMHRTRAPFFISISNRARVIGADVAPFSFDEHETTRSELLATNVNIGKVENITIHGIDISEVYGGSSFRGDRWKAYDGSQNKAAAIIAGYKLPDDADVEGGLTFRLPNGQHTGYIENIRFSDVNVTVKGGHAAADAGLIPPELGVGRYNVSDFRIQPAYGFWIRHIKGLILKDCVIRTEEADGRYAIVLDDVHKADITGLKIENEGITSERIRAVRSFGINY